MLSYVGSALKRDTFLPTKGPLLCRGMNRPECIRVTRQAAINANRMKGVIKRDKCRHEQCRKTKKMEALARDLVNAECSEHRKESSQLPL